MGLLSDAAEMLKPGGMLCYSTCSIRPDENTLLVKRFLQEHSSFNLEAEKLVLPSAEQPDHDGCYVAVMASRA
jgi:16S rRNA (cytosine967-C5)-methyltransferase